MDKRLCVAPNNITFEQDDVPLRIAVFNTEKSQPNCSVHFNLVNAIIKTLDIAIQINYSPTIGSLVDGKWNGDIGQLVNNELDVVVGTYVATYERFQATQLSTPIGFSSPLSILSGRISEHSIQNDFHVFKTFSMSVWIFIIISIIVISTIEYHLHKVHIENLLYRIILAYSAILGQSSRQLVRYCCFKHLIVFGINLYCFTCLRLNFQIFILMDQVQNSLITIDSIDDIVNLLSSTRSNLSVIASCKYLTWKIMENSEDENFRKVFKQLIDSDVYDIGFEDIYLGRQISLNNGGYLKSVVNANKHLGFHLGSEQYYESPNVIFYSKTIDKSVKEKIDSVIDRVFESGLADYWWALTFEHRIDMNVSRDDDNQTITMESIRGIFILLVTINFLLIYILIFEDLINKSKTCGLLFQSSLEQK